MIVKQAIRKASYFFLHLAKKDKRNLLLVEQNCIFVGKLV
jgi:hypothetical protein